MKSTQRATGRPASLVLLAILIAAASSGAIAQVQRFRVLVQDDGVYRMDYARLVEAGLEGPVASVSLALANRGQAIALRVDDGGDGEFGPGDRIIFVGSSPRGEHHHHHEYTPFNVYLLSTASSQSARRMAAAKRGPVDPDLKIPARPEIEQHLERDLLRVPQSGPTGFYGDETLWYWMQLNHLTSEPTRIPIDLTRLDPDTESSFDLKLQFLGGSDHASSRLASVPDHVVEIALNGTPIGRSSWQGRRTHLVEIESIPHSLAEPDGNVLELRVPLRREAEDQDPVIDVIYLDWIEATFPRDLILADGQERVRLPAGSNTGWLRLERPARGGKASEQIDYFSGSGYAATARARQSTENTSTSFYEAPVPSGELDIWVVPEGKLMHPPAIEIDEPSNLASDTTQRDYFIVAHSSLVEAARPLAEFHNKRGTRTEVVDVQDIYDEFNFGIQHPRAIREFLAHAFENRDRPAPSHVLLIGDADWYVRAHGTSDAAQAHAPPPALIPTWQLRSRDGPAASDNPYVTLAGDDMRPEMAIGRFPARTPEEAKAMVEKTIAYMQEPPAGPWRSRIVLVSDSERNLSARNELLANSAREAGLQAVELLSEEADNGEQHQTRLRSSIDEGMLVLHFFGHGGRFMWQTAPSRQGDASNLFDMEDLDALAPSTRLPIILSMSCNTGPFDHPAADSLAEKFLRLDQRGAVAIVAASARNSPSVKFTSDLMDGILGKGTLGEALMSAKNPRQHPDAIVFYNLFGDPALVPARP